MHASQHAMQTSQVSSLIADGTDVILVGEFHDDPVAHEVQLRMLTALSSHHDANGTSTSSTSRTSSTSSAAGSTSKGARRVSLSLEQFESDVQGVMDEYLAGHISEPDMVKDARAW